MKIGEVAAVTTDRGAPRSSRSALARRRESSQSPICARSRARRRRRATVSGSINRPRRHCDDCCRGGQTPIALQPPPASRAAAPAADASARRSTPISGAIGTRSGSGSSGSRVRLFPCSGRRSLHGVLVECTRSWMTRAAGIENWPPDRIRALRTARSHVRSG